MKRLRRGIRRHGPAALPHKNSGRKPKHALPETTRRLIVELAGGPYRGASCPHIAELLAQGHDILVSPRTVHRLLAASSLNRARRRSPRRHRTRPRMPQEGSYDHPWKGTSWKAYLRKRANLSAAPGG